MTPVTRRSHVSLRGAAFYTGWYSLDHYPRGGPNWSANAVIKGITITAVFSPSEQTATGPHKNRVVRRYKIHFPCSEELKAVKKRRECERAVGALPSRDGHGDI